MSINERLFSVISRNVNENIRNVSMDSSLKKDLGLDSLDRLVLILDVEREFGIKLLDEHVKHIQTLRDLEGFITAYLSRNNSNHYQSFPTDYFYIS